MRVIVTGATGFLGARLVERLLARGESVRILARSRAKAKPLERLGAELVEGEITDREALRRAVRDVEVVHHLAGRLFAPGVPEAEYHRTHVEGTRALLAACREQTGLKRLVHCSTTGVLGVTGDRPAGEDAPAAPTNAYEATKWQSELLVRTSQQEGFPATIVRPGLVYGPGDLHLLGFFRSVQRGWFRPIGSRAVWFHPIYVDDLVDAFILGAEHPLAVGECFHVAGREPVTVAGLAAAIAVVLDTALPRGVLPLPVARAAATLGGLLPARLKPLAPLTPSRLDFLTHSRVYDTGKAQRLLGFTADTGLHTGLIRAVAWYRERSLLPKPGQGGLS
ncbi:MAG: NAD-dependent epimerase/dehydratase family protein [Armatimonadetes bacterium]|nr:NAD-dependent epimerase/dehydratase family protein [Armatimonadota bacterium]